jgi:NAD-dependent dihydropyrimidine dehydrogenase PreA subunit
VKEIEKNTVAPHIQSMPATGLCLSVCPVGSAIKFS